jgi:hypothetical protein
MVNQYIGNLAPMPGVFENYAAPIVRTGAEGRELATAWWGMKLQRHLSDGTLRVVAQGVKEDPAGSAT